ncbi:MAG: peptide-methionine (S)-S-oxide reductase [Parcubacteria group bacterium Gr01-1014_107]|nr:MAG: peptide-methionine (S)-S-oxide reductase [Parcubacteria group bacterium Gr01-1014_107]
MTKQQKTEKAYLAAGCFWGIEEAFRKLPGVVETRVGYAGGHAKNPTYEDVCSDQTGHAETVEITFDPVKITFEEILKKFWQIHDPTTPNRQGTDVGSQYRSVIFYLSEEQKQKALKLKEEQEERELFSAPMVTEISSLKPQDFYPAEEYHQQYLAKKGAAVCH